MTELKRCPFCGGDASLHSNYSEKAGCYYIYAKCPDCYARGKSVKSIDPVSAEAGEEAISAWNTRTEV